MLHRGSCLCGSITYTVSGELKPLIFCHCQNCRKANGSAFLSAVPVAPDRLTLNDPHGYLKAFESSPGMFRHFCGNCATPLFSRRLDPNETLKLRVGSLDTPLEQSVGLHIFYADKAEWYEPGDDAPKYAQGPTSKQL